VVFIQTLPERTKYTGELGKVAENITKYQTIHFLPKVGVKGITKEGGRLERAVQEVKETTDGRFVIDGVVAESFKPQIYGSDVSNNAYQTTSPLKEDYSANQLVKNSNDNESPYPTHTEIEERIRDSKYKSMGIIFGTGKQFSPKKNDFWNNVLSKMGSYFTLTSVCYSFA